VTVAVTLGDNKEISFLTSIMAIVAENGPHLDLSRHHHVHA